jgi:hypothetical protein
VPLLHHAEAARKRAVQAAQEEYAAACLLWSEQMGGFGGSVQPSPTIAQCLNGGSDGLIWVDQSNEGKREARNDTESQNGNGCVPHVCALTSLPPNFFTGKTYCP